MGIKNLIYPDLQAPPTFNPDYFIPINQEIVLLDRAEKEEFQSYIKTLLLTDAATNTKRYNGLYAHSTSVMGKFAKTVKLMNSLLHPIGIMVRNLTIFMAPPNIESHMDKQIHIDSMLDITGRPVILEARLSIYEMAASPGVIRWYPHNEPNIYNKHHWESEIISKFRNNQLSWEEYVDYDFSTSTACAAAIIRTNLPHHVIQGPGQRITVSAQLVFTDGNPTGVWDHISKNYNKIPNIR